MIDVQYATKLPLPTICYGCGKRNDDKTIRIEVKNPRMRGITVAFLCDACRRELREKI